MIKYNYEGLPIGAIVSRPKAGGYVSHKGLVIEDGILHLSPIRNAEVTNDAGFSAGQNITVETSGVDHTAYPELAGRAREVLSRKRAYHFIGNNCEHFVNYIRNGERVSPQLQAGVLMGLVAMFLFRASK